LSFVTPRTWSAAELVTAAKMNEIRDALRSSGGATTTSVPGSPTDEDEFTYPADTTNGAMWRFKYRSASGSAFKWEFIGGSYMSATVETSEGNSLATYADLATVGPSITVPRAGDYEVEFGITAIGGGGNAVWVAVKKAAAATSDNDGVPVGYGMATPGSAGGRKLIVTGLAASDVLKLQYRGAIAAAWTCSRRWIAVRPVRIS
jgi:hypothetical protein